MFLAPKMKSLDKSVGWLVDPNNKWAIRFDDKLNSGNESESEFSIDMWGLDLDGKPVKFKSRRKASRIDSLKTWNQLLSYDWTKTNFNNVRIA